MSSAAVVTCALSVKCTTASLVQLKVNFALLCLILTFALFIALTQLSQYFAVIQVHCAQVVNFQ